MGPEVTTKNRLVVGVDYGTTYTGIAYADSKYPQIKDINLVSDWPGKKLITNEKVPSQIAYGDFEPTGYRWGNDIPPGVPRHYWTKLQLDESPNSDFRAFLAMLLADMKGLDISEFEKLNPDGNLADVFPPLYPGKDAKDTVADYLTGVHDHIFNKILVERYGRATLDTLQIEVVLTVPAVWSDKAKALTLEAASMAGFGAYKLSMITEPEAAAIYTLKSMQAGVMSDQFRVGDHFVLCDAGGGTVDLVSYRLTAIEPLLKMEEAAVGNGDKCGSSMIDRTFKEWLKKKLGEKNYSRIPTEKLQAGSKIMNQFESGKRDFNGDGPEQLISLPREVGIDEDDALGISDGELLVTGEDFAEMFDPHVNRTIGLIESQANDVKKSGKAVKWVFLVGGFGQSDYLFKRVSQWSKARGIEVLRPQWPWSAVVRGAVARGLETTGTGLVQVRMCRRFYGTPVCHEWDPNIHIEDDAFVDELTGRKMASGQMRWMLHKGEALSEEEPKRANISCVCTFKKTDDRMFGANLVACNEDTPPTRYMHKDALQIAKLQADLSSVPDHKFQSARRGPKGEPYMIAIFDIEIILTAAQIECQLLFDGESYGSITAVYT